MERMAPSIDEDKLADNIVKRLCEKRGILAQSGLIQFKRVCKISVLNTIMEFNRDPKVIDERVNERGGEEGW